MKQLLKNLYGLLVTLINNHDKRIKKMELKFTELANYVAKELVSIDEVKDLVTKEHEAANAESAAALASLATDILAKAQGYTDSGNAKQDSAMGEVVVFLNQMAEKVNIVGGIIGTPVPPVVPPIEVPVETPTETPV